MCHPTLEFPERQHPVVTLAAHPSTVGAAGGDGWGEDSLGAPVGGWVGITVVVGLGVVVWSSEEQFRVLVCRTTWSDPARPDTREIAFQARTGRIPSLPPFHNQLLQGGKSANFQGVLRTICIADFESVRARGLKQHGPHLPVPCCQRDLQLFWKRIAFCRSQYKVLAKSNGRRRNTQTGSRHRECLP